MSFYSLGHREESSLGSQLPVLVASPNIQLSGILTKQKGNKRREETLVPNDEKEHKSEKQVVTESCVIFYATVLSRARQDTKFIYSIILDFLIQ